MAESLAELAARARRGEKVEGGTVIPAERRGKTEHEQQQESGGTYRPTLILPADSAEEVRPGLATRIREEARIREEKAKKGDKPEPTKEGKIQTRLSANGAAALLALKKTARGKK